MDIASLVSELQKNGQVTTAQVNQWKDLASHLAVLDAAGREGANVVVKVDGGRTNGAVYTVVVSGGRLGAEFFHKDSADLAALVREAIETYFAKKRP